jgi:hypothetical protein
MTQLAERTARQLAFVDEFWFGPSARGTGLPAPRTAGPSLSGLKVAGRKPRRSRLVAALGAGLVVVLVAAFFVLRGGGSAQGQVFQYALEPGHKQVYDLTISLNGVAAGVPDAPPIEGTLSAKLAYEVVSRDGNGTVVEFVLEDVRTDPPSALGSGQSATKLRVTIAPNGSVTAVEGAGGVFGAAGSSMNSVSSLPGGPSDTAGSQFMFPEYSVNKIAPGDGWNEETTVPLPFGDASVTVKTIGTHNGFGDDPAFGRVAKFHHAITAPLDMEFSIAELFSAMGESLGGDAGSVPQEAADVVMKITGDMSMDADSLVVPETSELLRLDGTAKMSMRMVMEGLPDDAGAPGDLAFDLTMKIGLVRVDGATAKDAAPKDAAAAGSAGAAGAADAADAADAASGPATGGAADVPAVDTAPVLDPAAVPGSDGVPVPGADPDPAGYGDDPVVGATG